jgi:hypothetical protein
MVVIGCKFLIAVVMTSSAFCDIPPCSPLTGKQLFEATCRLNLQGQRIIKARNEREIRACRLLSCYFLVLTYSSTLKIEVTCCSEPSLDFQRTALKFYSYSKS